MEKPIAETSTEARELAALADRTKRIFQTGHIFRFDPAADFAKQYIDAGNLGRVQSLSGLFSGFKRPRADGGVTMSDAIHFIDLFNYLLGRMPDKVLARCNDVLQRGMDDLSWIWMDYDGTFGVVEANYFSPDKKRLVTVIGEKETLVCDFAASQDKITIYRNRHIQDDNTWRTVSGEIVRQEILPAEPLLLELRDFLRCVETRSTPKATAYDGADAIKIVEAAMESHRQGREITLS